MRSKATASVTLKKLLFPGKEPPADLRKAAVASAQRDHVDAAIARLTPIGLDILGAEIGHVVGEMLNVEVGDIVRSALTQHQAIAEACRTTAADPGAEVIVTLAEHRFESDLSPSVDVVVDGRSVTTIRFEVAVEADVRGGLLVVARGHITGVRAGRTTLSVKLSCEGVTVAEHHEDVDLAGIVKLPSADTTYSRSKGGSVLTT